MSNGSFTRQQYDTLMKPINGTRIATRRQGGKELSFLESWDVRAHLIRILGFGNFDIITHDIVPVYERQIEIGPADNKRPGWSVAYRGMVTLNVRNPEGAPVCTYTESAVGEFSGPESILADLHDNAAKTVASDALKRCALNLGSQFGLSLYDNGSRREVVRGTLVVPEQEFGDEFKTRDEIGAEDFPDGTLFLVIRPEPEVTPVTGETSEQTQRIADSLGATVVTDEDTSAETNQDSAANAKAEASDRQS